jgi:hypothetical protein
VLQLIAAIRRQRPAEKRDDRIGAGLHDDGAPSCGDAASGLFFAPRG